MKQLLRNEKGFTILEVLIALVILAIGILTVGVMQTTAIKGNATASHLTIANTSTNDLFERLLNVSYGDPLLSAGGHTEAEFPPGQIILPPNVTGLTWTVRIGANPDVADDDGDGNFGNDIDVVGIKFINMVVTYTDNGAIKTRVINFFKHELL